MNNTDNLIEKAEELRKSGNNQESLSLYKKYLLDNNALLWLAKLSENSHEAFIAAELALKLEPGNEIAKRAIAKLSKKTPEDELRQDDIVKHIVKTTGMTLMQARAVNWFYRKINLPVGDALDKNSISLKDIGWASVESYNEHVKAASKTVLLYNLLKIETGKLPPSLEIVRGSRYSEKKERMSLKYIGMFAGIIFTLGALALIIIINNFLGFLSFKMNFLHLFYATA